MNKLGAQASIGAAVFVLVSFWCFETKVGLDGVPMDGSRNAYEPLAVGLILPRR